MMTRPRGGGAPGRRRGRGRSRGSTRCTVRRASKRSGPTHIDSTPASRPLRRASPTHPPKRASQFIPRRSLARGRCRLSGGSDCHSSYRRKAASVSRSNGVAATRGQPPIDHRTKARIGYAMTRQRTARRIVPSTCTRQFWNTHRPAERRRAPPRYASRNGTSALRRPSPTPRPSARPFKDPVALVAFRRVEGHRASEDRLVAARLTDCDSPDHLKPLPALRTSLLRHEVSLPQRADTLERHLGATA